MYNHGSSNQKDTRIRSLGRDNRNTKTFRLCKSLFLGLFLEKIMAHGLFRIMAHLNIPSEWAPSKLSEKHKINVIGPTKLKL